MCLNESYHSSSIGLGDIFQHFRVPRFASRLLLLPILAVECLAQANPTIPYPNPFDPSIHSTMTVEWSLAVS